jgi:hypothetical protein
MKNFTELAQSNVDFYNEHPNAHTAITVVYGVAAVIVINKLCKKIAGVKNN